MNKWECLYPRCGRFVTGVGGAVGLLAVGWFFRKGETNTGPIIYCPEHHPGKTTCIEDGDNRGKACSLCFAENQAKRVQALIGATEPIGSPKRPGAYGRNESG